MKSRDRKDFVPSQGIDILLVVNMFLTGFDAKTLNTLYVDKNLRYHGLIQAYSRTNRTLGSQKSQGNIACFRNLKAKTDEAIGLFSDEDAEEIILVRPMEDYLKVIAGQIKTLYTIATTPEAVDQLLGEDDQLEFVQAFRNVIRTLNVLNTFSEFDIAVLDIDAQELEDYKSKYLDIYERHRTDKEPGASIIDDVDFELEMIQRDEINVSYILKLLAKLRRAREANAADEIAAIKKTINTLLGQETQLRSKRELIQRFIDENIPTLKSDADVDEAFEAYWSAEKEAALVALCEAEQLDRQKVNVIIRDYQFTGKEPLREAVFGALEVRPKILERKTIFERILDGLLDIIRTFDDGMGG